MWAGELLAIHVAEAERQPMQARAQATLIAGQGVAGDRYALGTGKYSAFPDIREVTLIEIEGKRDAAAKALRGFLKGLGYV